MSETDPADEQLNLDPADWSETRALGHRMLDDMFDHLQQIRQQPVWPPAPAEIRGRFHDDLPREQTALAEVYRDFTREVLPYSVGNVHPAFMGWVHGGGTVTGMLAEMLAGAMNANLGGRDQIPILVERQIVEWVRQMFGFPDAASGLLVTGTSMANFIAVLVARNAALELAVRQTGVAIAAQGRRLVGYTSTAAHGCIAKAMDMSGLGADALHLIPTDAAGRIDIAALRRTIETDRRAGLTPFLLVGSAGTVDIGAIDDLDGLAEIARAESLWFHVDGAFGALAILAPEIRGRLKGIEQADSIAFDFHKWLQVPYDAGFILVRDGKLHLESFNTSAAYLQRATDGTAAGSPWPCDYGPELSRGFRALKVWFTIKVYGATKLGAVIAGTCALATYLKSRIEATPQLELAAPVELNIVCFRYRCRNSDEVNDRIVVAIQKSGIAVPSTTVLNGRLAVRAAIVNHRTQKRDIDALLAAVLKFGEELAG